MDIEKVTNNTKARESRESRAIKAFLDLYSSTDSALDEISKIAVSNTTKDTLLKSHVINTVTAVEVYYRDKLDSVFRLCKPTSFVGKLKKLHDRSYKIDDLLDMYVHRIHPLELVANNLNFQNIVSIEKTFTILLGKSFFKKTKNLKWRIKDMSDSETEISQDDIDAMQYVFEERHQLIHNPISNYSIDTEVIEKKLGSVLKVIMASELVISDFINDNIDPEIASNK